MENFSLAIHGGAGTILKSAMTDRKERRYHRALEASLKAGEKILSKGGSALDAVEAAVISMENSELFNAGKGSVFTHEGDHEMDASIMNGADRNAGAVAGVRRVKNPISLCREIMENCEHVFLIGEGAEHFAETRKLEMESKDYFSTDFRYEQLQKIRDTHQTLLDHSDHELKKFGTVGAVAKDVHGNLAAATSTGGITNKRYMRVGDTSIIGAGTYAENDICAVSSTGWGEYYIRAVAAYDVAAMMKYGDKSLDEAAHQLIHEVIPKMGGDGGLIAVDSNGKITMPFNTQGMYRGFVQSDGNSRTLIFK
ncbi:MAG: isoaspartyl peptidase/L-asparaginase [Flavobacteriales bacterium]|nr:isoaspartyl peptidase/L-asparaginase [Flavobacteriales bacterium]